MSLQNMQRDYNASDWSDEHQRYLLTMWDDQYQRHYRKHYVEGQGWVFLDWILNSERSSEAHQKQYASVSPEAQSQTNRTLTDRSRYGQTYNDPTGTQSSTMTHFVPSATGAVAQNPMWPTSTTFSYPDSYEHAKSPGGFRNRHANKAFLQQFRNTYGSALPGVHRDPYVNTASGSYQEPYKTTAPLGGPRDQDGNVLSYGSYLGSYDESSTSALPLNTTTPFELGHRRRGAISVASSRPQRDTSPSPVVSDIATPALQLAQAIPEHDGNSLYSTPSSNKASPNTITTKPFATRPVTTKPVTARPLPDSKAKAVQVSEATIGTVDKRPQAKPGCEQNASKQDKIEPTVSSDPERLNPELSKALAAWKTLFGDVRQAKLRPADKLPIHATRFLGRGGGGEVHATEVGGIAVAWKRYSSRARRLTEEELNEAKILEKMSKCRHTHVVELVGSYIHPYKGGIELGLLMWPVAHCDLASLLGDIDYIGDRIHLLASGTSASSPDDLESVLENLYPLLPPCSPSQGKADDLDSLLRLYSALMKYLYTKIGCIGEAVSYLHQQDIRHKDLKPAQILLSADGLWLTDFGWSRDTSQLTNSVTNGGDRITLRYHAPERATRGPCGKPEDVFALGCIYLEMAYRLARVPKRGGYAVPWARRPFYDNLEHLTEWVEPLSRASQTSLHDLAALIRRMLSHDPGERPPIALILSDLRSAHNQPSISADVVGTIDASFFTSCCAQERSMSLCLRSVQLKTQ